MKLKNLNLILYILGLCALGFIGCFGLIQCDMISFSFSLLSAFFFFVALLL